VAPDWIATDHRLAWADALEPVQKAALGVPEVMNSPEMLARLVVDLSHRSDYAGRVMVCRSGQPPQLLPYGDSGFSGLESFHDH
jgi:hypothetical protein